MRHVVLCILTVGLFISAWLPVPVKASGVERITHQELVRTIGASKGKVVLVNFWATWCGPCRREIPELIRMREHYSVDDLLVIGVSMDFSPAMLEKYMQKTAFNYPIYLGSKDIGLAYNISAIPKTVVYDRSGVQVLNHDGYMQANDLKQLIDALIAQ